MAYSPTNFLWLQVMAGVGYVTFFIFYFLVVPKPNLTTIERVMFLLVALVASILGSFLVICLGAPLGRTIGRCFSFGGEGARWSGALAALLVALSVPVFWVVKLYDGPLEVKLGGALVLPFLGVLLALELGALLGNAVARSLGLGAAQLQRWGVYAKLVIAFVGGGLGSFYMLLAVIFPKYEWLMRHVYLGLVIVFLILIARRALASLVDWRRGNNRWVCRTNQ